MANQTKNRAFIMGSSLIVSLLLLIGAVSLAGHLKGESQTAPASATLDMSKGALVVTVCDGMSDKPLAGARVVVAETGEEFATDSSGQTPSITVPILQNETFDKILEQPWGEVTLLVYRDGYLPYALFHTQVTPEKTRPGPKILLFTEKDAPSAQPFSIVEGPEKNWVNELIEKFADQS